MPDATPPDLTPYRRLLVFGGSFDPPHLAHAALPRQVAAAIDADVVLYIPAGRAPHKLDKRQTDPAHRLAMLRLALQGEPGELPGAGALVLDDEVRRADDGRPSYTVDTLEDLHARIAPDAEMRLLVGTDQVDIFESWHRWERVAELAEPVVMLRPSADGELPDEMPETWRGRVVEVTPTDVSSTAVRQRVRDGLSLDGWVHPEVAAYIARHELYRDANG